MTCIVGIVENGKVWMGADSAGVSSDCVQINKETKVFRKEEFIIGCTTSFRMIQLIKYRFKPPTHKRDVDVMEYMATSFIDTLRQCFQSGGFLHEDKGVISGGSFLVGYKGRLFSIQSDFQVFESADEFDACGSGESYALGALCAMDWTLPAEVRLKNSLVAACHLSTGVRPPFIIISE